MHTIGKHNSEFDVKWLIDNYDDRWYICGSDSDYLVNVILIMILILIKS